MNILALDTAVGVSVAVLTGDGILTESKSIGHGMQGELTAKLISESITSAGLDIAEITDVVIGVGPGPFTGLRAGIVTANVFGYASNLPVHGICSLDAVAFDYKKPCIVVTDARRKELYWAQYHQGRISEPQVLKPELLARKFTEIDFVGPGAKLYPDFVNGELIALRAGALAQLFASGAAQLVEVKPMYLRKPDAVEPTTRKSVL